MLFSKHILSLLSIVSLVAATEAIDKNTDNTYRPSYNRKAVNAHHNITATKHHFDDYDGYQDFLEDMRQHKKDVERHQAHARRSFFKSRKLHGKHIFHGKHKTVQPVEEETEQPTTEVAQDTDYEEAAQSSVDGVEEETTRRSSGSAFKLIKEYAGSSFFDDFSFYTGDDPSHGMIDYVGKSEAEHAGLIGLKNGNPTMRIAPGYANGVKKSVRPSTELTFTTGIIVLDAYHMPTGCGVWPAFWTMPKDLSGGGWPHGGEIDLVEGVHYFQRNMASIHAPSWCSVDAGAIDMLGELAMPDKRLAGNCNPDVTDDQGCGVKSTKDGDYGKAYNLQGGGVHVLYWDSNEGIHAYFFPRNKIPLDLEANKPNPWSWGKPTASWPATHCKPDDYFRKHAAVFTNTVCGTWAGSSSVWNNPMGGQKVSCKKLTGKSSCYEYMKSGPDLSTAFWEIKSLKIYQKSRRE